MKSGSKDKVLAIILAVFLSFFAWLYTYKADAWKFWLNLSIFFLLIFGSYISGSGLVAGSAGDLFRFFSIAGTVLFPLATWLWVVITAIVRKKDWYENYPDSI